MAVITPPTDVIRPSGLRIFLRSQTRSAGRSLLGREQILSSGISSWQVDYSLPTQLDGDLMRQFEAFIRDLRGRTNVAALSICDPYRYGPNVSPKQQPWSDDTWFSDNTGWIDPAGGVHPLEVTVAAAPGATALYVGITEPKLPRLRVGDYFSVDGFLYAVQNSTANGWVRFAPPARQAIPIGAILQTDPAVIHARLADDDQGARMREMLRWGAPITLSFVEAFDR